MVAIEVVNDAERIQPWLTAHARSQASDAPCPRLDWKEGRRTRQLLIDALPGGQRWLDLGDFSAALRRAELFDNTAVNLPGALVALPRGQGLVSRFCGIVRDHYERAGLLEYDYPVLAPMEAFAAFCDVFPAHERALYAGTAADFRAGNPRAALLPTGEAVIYAHWAKIVRDESVLPIEMFRHTRFYRPWSSSRRGRHAFNTLEGADTFEFHGCYAQGGTEEPARRFYDMLRGICDALAVPVLWSTRPPWSNYSQVSTATVGGDCPIPSGASLQVGTLYRQGTRFSERFGIRYRTEGGAPAMPEHLTGAMSRRLLLTHLCLGLADDGTFVVHPVLAGTHAHVVVRQTAMDSADEIIRRSAAWLSSALRVTVARVSSAVEVTRELKRAEGSGPPLTVLLQGRRGPTDHARVTVRRADDLREVCREEQAFDSVPSTLLTDALGDMTDAHQHRIMEYASRRAVAVRTADELRDVLTARLVADCPLAFVPAVGERIADWRAGEILGFVESGETEPCAVSGALGRTRAYVSPRA